LGAAKSRVHLATGVLEREGRILMVASRYPNHALPLWNLPGGRQRAGELLEETLRREFHEETGLAIEVDRLLYVSESYDRQTDAHFLNVTFSVRAEGQPKAGLDDAHIVGIDWVPRGEVGARLIVAAVREPLLAYLREEERRYFGFSDAGITIEFADES
jgi:ADP-ribose pyrophosphatase YjhB (NUDIX family)